MPRWQLSTKLCSYRNCPWMTLTFSKQSQRPDTDSCNESNIIWSSSFSLYKEQRWWLRTYESTDQRCTHPPFLFREGWWPETPLRLRLCVCSSFCLWHISVLTRPFSKKENRSADRGKNSTDQPAVSQGLIAWQLLALLNKLILK